MKWLLIWLSLAIVGILSLDYLLPLHENGEPSDWRTTIAWSAFMISWLAGLLIWASWFDHRFKKSVVSDNRLLE
jgi:hypothetical protein